MESNKGEKRTEIIQISDDESEESVQNVVEPEDPGQGLLAQESLAKDREENNGNEKAAKNNSKDKAAESKDKQGKINV